jgi:hypothetical protein
MNCLVFFLLLSFHLIYAQENNLSLFFNVGGASDNNAIGSFGGGGAGLQVWELGPIFRIGLEYKLNKSFSVQGIVSYSFYKYDGTLNYGENANDGHNRILDIMGNLKWHISIFYLTLGAGFSNQNNDEIKYLENQYHSTIIFVSAKNKNVFSGQFGLGFDISIYERLSVLAEGDLFFREYLGSAWLLGVKYSLYKK